MSRSARSYGADQHADGPQALRAITYAPAPKPSTKLHDRPELCLLPVSSLVVDPRYQRPIGSRGASNIKHILEKFDWRKFQPIVVTKIGGGKYAIIDGQHRATAALMHPEIDVVPCMIVKAGVEEAAECFAAINGCVTAVHCLSLFAARVAAGETQALRIKALVDDAGVRVLRYPLPHAKLKPADTLAIGAIETLNRLFPRPLVVQTLKALRVTRDGRSTLLQAPLIHALAAVLSRNPRWVEARGLIDVISKANLEAALDASPALARARQTSRATVIEAAIERALAKALGPGIALRKGEVVA